MELKYFTGEEKERGIFYAVPKVMFINEELREISLKSKIVYSLLLDRVDLSKKNGWKKDGYIYILYSQKKLAEKLGLNEKTIRNAFKELIIKKLIKCKKRGQGEAQEIWVKNLNTVKLKSNDYQTDQSYTPAHEVKPSKDKKRINELEAEIEKLKSKIEQMEEEIILSKNGKNDQSRVEKNTEQEWKKTPTIKTKKNKTNYIKTKSLFQREREREGKKDKLQQQSQHSQSQLSQLSQQELREELKQEVRNEIKRQETLPYEYVEDSRKMEEALKEITLYESNKELAEGRETTYIKGLKLFISTLTRMLTKGEKQIIKGEEVSRERIYEKVVEDIGYNYKGKLCLDTIVWNTIEVYEEASKRQRIKSPISYMMTCIWSVLQNEYVMFDGCE